MLDLCEKYAHFGEMTYGVDQPAVGRPKGVPNRGVVNAREAIAMFVDDNSVRLTGWLDRIAEDNPKAAFDAFMSVVEYHIPKLSRTENTNTNIDGVAAMSTERLLQLERIVSRMTGSEALLIAPEPKKLASDDAEAELASLGSQTIENAPESKKNGLGVDSDKNSND